MYVHFSVFQLDFDIFRTIASFIKISSGHSVIIKIILIKFFRTIWEIGGKMSWDRCQAESLIFIYQYILIFWFVNWSWIKLTVVRHDSTLNQSTSQLSMSYSFVPCSCWCVLNFHWVAASVKRFTIKFTIQIPPSLNLVVTISRLKIAACGLKQAFNLSIILASHKVISCKCKV
jgi:hypothetical protein